MNDDPCTRVLILDDEPSVCKLLEAIIAKWGMHPESFLHIGDAADRLKQQSFDLALLDVQVQGICGLDLIPEIQGRCPDAKIIVITGYADKETAIRALRDGAFDFLEKPFELEFLSHTMERALQTLSKERSLKKLVQDLEQSKNELMTHKEQLEFLNNQLMETNDALTTLAKNIELERSQTETRIAMKLKSLVIPAIKRLQQDKSLARYEGELDMLIKQIEDLTAGFGTDAVISSKLSFTELRIASLIKNGLTSEEIAEKLHVSSSTIRTHRKNIRKKLQINRSQYNLRNFLTCSHVRKEAH